MTPAGVWLDALTMGHTREGAIWMDGRGLHDVRRRGDCMALRGLVDGKWWLPCHQGQRLLVVPTYDPWSDVLVDVIAVDPARPADIHFLTGKGSLLGSALFRFGTVRLYQHVTAWLKDSDGLCLLEPSVARNLLAGTPRLELRCDSREHALEVHAAFDGANSVVPAITYVDDDAYLEAAE